MEKTLLYHYTSLSHLIEIFKVGKLHTSQTEKMLKVKKPGLWFSTNSKWEYSAFKRFNDGNKEAVMGVFKYKDGKVIAFETGATPMPK